MKTIFKKGFLTILAIIIGLSSIGVVAAETLSDSLWADTNMCSEVDPKTGLTCDEIDENPDQDVYYVVISSHFDDAIWETAHQDPETARWDDAHTKFIVKYNSNEIPRSEFGLEKALGVPMSHSEIIAYLNDPLNGFFDAEYYLEHPLIPLVPLEEVLPLVPEELLPILPEEPITPLIEDPIVTEEPILPPVDGEPVVPVEEVPPVDEPVTPPIEEPVTDPVEPVEPTDDAGSGEVLGDEDTEETPTDTEGEPEEGVGGGSEESDPAPSENTDSGDGESSSETP